MAEAFGVAAGVAGFVSLLGQFVGAANTLREIRTYADKAPADLDAVVPRHYGSRHLVAGAEAGQRVRDRRRSRVLPPEDRVRV